MKTPDARITFAATGKPADFVPVPEGGISIRLRVDWLADPPDVIARTEWHSDKPCEFLGDYEHIKAVRPSEPCEIWARIYDANGFYFDTPRVPVLTYSTDDAA